MERAIAFTEGALLRPDDLPERIRTSGGASAIIAGSMSKRLTLHELEREYILEALRQTVGNKTRAAELLGLDRTTLYRKLDEYRAADPSLEI